MSLAFPALTQLLESNVNLMCLLQSVYHTFCAWPARHHPHKCTTGYHTNKLQQILEAIWVTSHVYYASSELTVSIEITARKRLTGVKGLTNCFSVSHKRPFREKNLLSHFSIYIFLNQLWLNFPSLFRLPLLLAKFVLGFQIIHNGCQLIISGLTSYTAQCSISIIWNNNWHLVHGFVFWGRISHSLS